MSTDNNKNPGSVLRNFLHELQRRRVPGFVAGYIVMAWVAIEVASVILPAFEAPDWMLRGLIIAAVALSPLAVVLAWFFDLTRRGLVLTDEVADQDAEGAKGEEDSATPDEEIEPGQEEAIFDVVVRAYEVTHEDVANMSVAQFEKRYAGEVIVEQVVRGDDLLDITPDLTLMAGDRGALIGRRKQIAVAGKSMARETANLSGLGFVNETREAALTNRKLIGAYLRDAKTLVAAEYRRGVYITGLTRAGHRST